MRGSVDGNLVVDPPGPQGARCPARQSRASRGQGRGTRGGDALVKTDQRLRAGEEDAEIVPTANLLKSPESRPKGGVTRIHPCAPAAALRPATREGPCAREDGTALYCRLPTRFRTAAGKRAQRGRPRALSARGERPRRPPRPPGTSVPAADLLTSLGGEGRLPQPGRLPALSAFHP